MSIHQEINPNTVDPAQLPDHMTANKVMKQVSKLLWDLDNAESYTTFHDFWANSTSAQNVRMLRVRHKNTPAVQAVMPKVAELLASYEGMYKTYLHGKYFLQGDTGYDVHTGHAMCITLYYRSWQPGDPRITQQPDPGYELTLHKGDRIEYRTNTGTWVKATILKRYPNTTRRPSYKIKTDEPHSQPYKGTIEDLPAWQRDTYYRTYAMQPDVRAIAD